MTRSNHPRPGLRWRSMYVWHRYVGLIISLVLIVMAVTGLILNHSEDLELDKGRVESAWLLDWYGIGPAPEPVSFIAGKHTVSGLEQHVYFNQQRLGDDLGQLVGVVSVNGIYVIATTEFLVLVNPTGELIERQPRSQFSATPIRGIGLSSDNNPVIRTGTGLIQSNAALLSWKPFRGSATWSKKSKADAGLKAKLKMDFRANQISLERFMADVHSGRFFGSAGRYLTDITAILLVYLSISGIWLWINHLKKQRERAASRTEQEKP